MARKIVDIRDYDMGLLRRFQFYYPNTVWVNRANISISEIRDNKIYEGKDITFPVLILRRTQCPIIYKDNNSFSQLKTGDRRTNMMPPEQREELGYPDDLTIVNSAYELKYDLEVLALDRDNFDELVIETQENLRRFPYMTFDADDKIIDGVSVHLMLESVQDNSDLDNFDEHTPFYRATINLTMRAWIYRKYRRYKVDDFTIHLYLKDAQSPDEPYYSYNTKQGSD